MCSLQHDALPYIFLPNSSGLPCDINFLLPKARNYFITFIRFKLFQCFFKEFRVASIIEIDISYLRCHSFEIFDVWNEN